MDNSSDNTNQEANKPTIWTEIKDYVVDAVVEKYCLTKRCGVGSSYTSELYDESKQ